jgi:hypothetical protein
MAWAISSAVTRRPMGWRALSTTRSASGSSARSSRRPIRRVSAVPGGDAVDPDAGAHQVGGGGPGEGEDRSLGRGVQDPVGQSGGGGDGTRVDDRGGGGAPQVRKRGPGDADDAEDVDVEETATRRPGCHGQYHARRFRDLGRTGRTGRAVPRPRPAVSRKSTDACTPRQWRCSTMATARTTAASSLPGRASLETLA